MIYDLYLADNKIAEFEYDCEYIKLFNIIKPNLLPKQEFTQFIRERAFCYELQDMRSFIKSTFNTFDQVAASIYNNMISVSDKYWCVESGDAGWVVDTDNLYINSSQSLLRFPNVCTNGSFSKTWIKENGKWYLIKEQGHWSTISEYFISNFLLKIGYPTQVATINSATSIRCLNFVEDKETFEPYSSYRFSYANKFDSEEAAYENLEQLGFRKILFIDALVMNVDRHSRNFGIIRNVDTGEVVRLAPNYDNNLSFLSDGIDSYSDVMLKSFIKQYGITNEEKEIIDVWNSLSRPLINSKEC